MRLRRNRVRIRDTVSCKDVFAMVLPGRGLFGSSGSIAFVRTAGTRSTAVLTPFARAARARRYTRAPRPVSVKEASGSYMLVMRSGRRLLRLLASLLSPLCQVIVTVGNGSKLRGTVRRHPSLVLDSIVVPGVSNVRVYSGVGASFSLYRAPMMLLATLASGSGGLRKLRYNTSRCVKGPFGGGVLRTHVTGVLHGQGLLGRGFDRGVAADRSPTRVRVRTLTLGPVSTGFLRRLRRAIGTRLSSSRFSINTLTGRVTLDHDTFCGGLGTLDYVSPGRFVVGTHLGCTTRLLEGRPRLRVARVTCRAKFDSLHCFQRYFGTYFGRSPRRCEKG